MTERTYSTREVTGWAGISKRQLQWWHEHGIVRCHKNGHGNRYSRVEVAVVSVIAELRRKGVRLSELRRLGPGIRSAVAGCSKAQDKIVYAVVAERRIGFHLSTETAIAKAREEKAVRVVDVGQIFSRIEGWSAATRPPGGEL